MFVIVSIILFSCVYRVYFTFQNLVGIALDLSLCLIFILLFPEKPLKQNVRVKFIPFFLLNVLREYILQILLLIFVITFNEHLF